MKNFETKQHYFDLKGFFEKEIQELQKSNPRVMKIVTIDHYSEMKEFRNMNFNKELERFIDCDINKPAWRDKYTIDSLFKTNSALTAVRYRSNDPKLKISFIEIKFNESNEPIQISIHNQVNSLIARIEEHLIYEPGKGYSIENTQFVLMTKPKKLKIEAHILF